MRYFCSPNQKTVLRTRRIVELRSGPKNAKVAKKVPYLECMYRKLQVNRGSMQNMLFRGVSTPIFSKGDVASTQPVVFLNGIPLLMNDAFVYNVKSTEVNPIGTATNILSGLNRIM